MKHLSDLLLLIISCLQGSEWHNQSLTASERLKLFYESQKSLEQRSSAETEALQSNTQRDN
jgi:hypothetical protein